MGNGTPRHYKVRRNRRAYWEPTKAMRKMGFVSVPLGADGPQAFAVAEEWNRRWDGARKGLIPSPARTSAENLSPERAEDLTIYPPRSFGSGFAAYRRTPEWARKSPRTREDWWRGWKRIKPIFGDVDPRTVTLDEISILRQHIEEAVSLREAHRTIKIWRALWKVVAALGFCGRDEDPSLAVRNSAAKGRNQTWSEGEAVRLVKRAIRMGYLGLAAAMASIWDSQMNPGDVREMRASQMAMASAGRVFFTERGKTGTPVGGLLSARTLAVMAHYFGRLGVELHGDAYVFRNRSGAHYSKDTLGDDFRKVRAAEFGALETRMLGHDFRRSGAVEAITGEATPAAVAHAMGNTLSASNTLFATYVPINTTTIRQVAEARRRGREKLR